MEKRLPSTLTANSSMRRRSEKYETSRMASSCTTTARDPVGVGRFDKDLPLPPQDNAFSDIPLTPRLLECGATHNPPPLTSKLPLDLSRLLPKRRTMDPSPPPSPPPASLASTTKPCSVPARPKLFNNYSSSANFTQKWPIPRLNPSAISGLIAALDESGGLGMDRVDTWTVHKWTLLLSIITAFITSFAGLICAILTWFRGPLNTFELPSD
jgi:hypothetical protein